MKFCDVYFDKDFMFMIMFTSIVTESGIIRDKTMNNKLMHNPNCDKQNHTSFRLKLLLEKLGLC